MRTIGLIQATSIRGMSVRPAGRRMEAHTTHMVTAVTAATLLRAMQGMGMEAVTGDPMLAATAGAAETVVEAVMAVEAAEVEAVVVGAAAAAGDLWRKSAYNTRKTTSGRREIQYISSAKLISFAGGSGES